MVGRPDISEQLPGAQALRLAKTIILEGSVVFTRHAHEEMEKDDLLETDVVNTISGGVINEPGELGHRGDWCFQVRTSGATVVILFRSVEEMVVVTAWREQRRGR
jgi:hypothetical protein